MVKHTQTIRRPLLANCLSVFDRLVGLALKVLTSLIYLFVCLFILFIYLFEENQCSIILWKWIERNFIRIILNI